MCEDGWGGQNCSTKLDLSCVTYEAFGARGDGVTNDLPAIVAAHNFANYYDLCVRAKYGATYYISDIAESAVIATRTIWSGANFIIDDSNIGAAEKDKYVFIVSSKIPARVLINEGVNTGEGAAANLTSLSRHQTHIDVNLPWPAVLVPFDVNTRRYIRTGNNANQGAIQQEAVLVDQFGNVSETSPIIWDYNNITHLYAFPVDSEVLTISGGVFTTIANRGRSSGDNYYNRGINITRSNVIINSLEHYVTNEGDSGAPYAGFITMNWAANIVIQNTILTAHKTFDEIGTYDIQPVGVVNLLLSNVKQSNDIMAISRFGVFASNFCKNIVLDSCELNRFDAHMGVVNITINNSEIGYRGINAIGEGTLLVQHTRNYGYSFIVLRDDYGTTWNGNIVIRSCIWEPLEDMGGIIPGSFAYAPFIYADGHDSNHWYGYNCYIPNLDIDGLEVNNSRLYPVYLFGEVTSNNSGPYPIQPPQYVRVRNYEEWNWSLYDGWRVSENNSFFSSTIRY